MAGDPIQLRSERMFGIFARYLAWRMSRDFHAVRVSVRNIPVSPPRSPIIVYCNHPSWWDPALCIVVAHRLFPGRPGFAPMEQRSFERYGVFRRMGVFGVALDRPAGARRFLDVSDRALSIPNGMMWINAEGAFTDTRVRPVVLRPGVAHLARRRPDAVLLPMAIAVEFWEESRPEALVRFGQPVTLDGLHAVGDIAARLATELERTMDKLALDSMSREPGRFTTLVSGRAGADRIYDNWRRAKSVLRGRRFDPAHGAGQ